MLQRYLLLLILNSSALLAQDTVKTDNKWFTEFQIANSSGFTLDLINGVDLAIGRRIFKNTDLRILGGFNTGNTNVKSEDQQGNVITDSYENQYNRFSTGFDILYRIVITEKLLFKTGLGYEYFYSKGSSIRNAVDGKPVRYKSENKEFSNKFKSIGSFHFSFTNNIYAFVQAYLLYERSHGSFGNSISGSYNEFSSSNFKQNTFKLDNFILGGGISF